MRNLLILLLAAAVVWLVMERIRLADALAAAKTETETSAKRVEELERISGIGPRSGAPGSRSGWINDHVEKGARSLDAPKAGGRH